MSSNLPSMQSSSHHIGGTVAKAFTNAFVHAKVVEIRSQMEVCLNCSCTLGGALCEALPAANFSECLRRPSELDQMSAQEGGGGYRIGFINSWLYYL